MKAPAPNEHVCTCAAAENKKKQLPSDGLRPANMILVTR